MNVHGSVSVSADTKEILRMTRTMLRVTPRKGDIFGNGNAVEKIAEVLHEYHS